MKEEYYFSFDTLILNEFSLKNISKCLKQYSYIKKYYGLIYKDSNGLCFKYIEVEDDE